MRIIFFGSDDFAAVNLQRLLDDRWEICACVTQPDRPQGRGMKLTASPIKRLAESYQIPVHQPEDLKAEGLIAALKAYEADLFIVIAYGKFLTSKILKIPKIFSINVHGSLLPQYRGAAPINWAIIHGETHTGYTIMKMSPKMDAGDIIFQEKIPITADDNSQTLREKMAKLSSVGLSQAVKWISTGHFTLIPQEEPKVTFAPKLSKELGLIDWSKPGQDIHNLVRGLMPWPTAYTHLKEKMLKILKSQVISQPLPAPAGQVIDVSPEGIVVACGKDALLLIEVQPESGKPMPSHSFAVGHQVKEGTRFNH